MANPTTNYGFVLPTPTDLVTDLPADFEVALQGVDTQMKTNADAATQKATLTTTGDIYYASGANTPARLGIGTTGQFLSVSGGVPAWANAAGFGTTVLSTTSLSGSSTTISGIAGASYSALYLITTALQSTSGNSSANMTINGVTSGYVGSSSGFNWSANIKIGNLGTSSSSLFLTILNVKATSGNKYFMLSNVDQGGTTVYIGSGYLPQNAVVSSITINGSATLSGVMHLLGS